MRLKRTLLIAILWTSCLNTAQAQNSPPENKQNKSPVRDLLACGFHDQEKLVLFSPQSGLRDAVGLMQVASNGSNILRVFRNKQLVDLGTLQIHEIEHLWGKPTVESDYKSFAFTGVWAFYERRQFSCFVDIRDKKGAPVAFRLRESQKKNSPWCDIR